jgi:spore maturation protein CgeB
MKIRLFYHSLLSDWNHGNAHFLRGVVTELMARGHDVRVYEPVDAWSLRNLLEQHGRGPLRQLHRVYPRLKSVRYDPATFDLGRALAGADLVIVHEWNSPELVRRIGELRRRRPFVLLYHDTHHRLVTQPEEMRALPLGDYDGVLAYGDVLRRMYQSTGLAARVWTWHEAADTRVFRPLPARAHAGDLVWVGNWGDDERTEELREFLIEPVRALGLKARVYGVRYPDAARAALADAGIEYAGWLPNFAVPEVFAQFRVTVHIPRRPYATQLPGIPTIRPFEALACGIPLVCSPWRDAERLFNGSRDYRMARDGTQMTRHLRTLLADEDKRKRQAAHGLATIRSRHSCAHRVRELLQIHGQVLAERRKVVVPATRFFRRHSSLVSEATAS